MKGKKSMKKLDKYDNDERALALQVKEWVW